MMNHADLVAPEVEMMNHADLYDSANWRDEIIARNDPQSAARTPFTYRAFTVMPMGPGSDHWHIMQADPVAAAVYALVTGNAWTNHEVKEMSAELILCEIDNIWNRATVELLTRAKARIADPARWTQHANARNSIGEQVGASDAAAVQWCAHGTLVAEMVDCHRSLYMMGFRFAAPAGTEREIVNCHVDLYDMGVESLEQVPQTMDYCGLQDFNDGVDHTAVLAMFDAAIAQQEEASCES